MTKRQQLTTALMNFYQRPVAKVSLELFFSVGAVLFFAIFAIRPTLLTMSDLIKELEDKRELDQQLSQKIAALSTVQATYLGSQNRLGVLDEAIPPTPQFIYSLKLLEKVASENRLAISTVNVNEIPEEIVASGQTSRLERVAIPISVVIAGDYASIRSFIEDVLALRRSFVVDTVVFAKSEERGTQVLKATISLSLPYLSENKSVTNAQNESATQKNASQEKEVSTK